jgi:hypothetical protein
MFRAVSYAANGLRESRASRFWWRTAPAEALSSAATHITLEFYGERILLGIRWLPIAKREAGQTAGIVLDRGIENTLARGCYWAVDFSPHATHLDLLVVGCPDHSCWHEVFLVDELCVSEPDVLSAGAVPTVLG